jgi:hypothetical protein
LSVVWNADSIGPDGGEWVTFLAKRVS